MAPPKGLLLAVAAALAAAAACAILSSLNDDNGEGPSRGAKGDERSSDAAAAAGSPAAKAKDRGEGDATPKMGNLASLTNEKIEGGAPTEGNDAPAAAVTEEAEEQLPSTVTKRKKKKKLRPKLTPIEPAKSEEEDDEDGLGFGDIAVSRSPPKPTPSRAKLRPVSTKQNEEEGEEERPGEDADYGKLSSYWKQQAEQHEFVSPKSKTATPKKELVGPGATGSAVEPAQPVQMAMDGEDSADGGAAEVRPEKGEAFPKTSEKEKASSGDSEPVTSGPPKEQASADTTIDEVEEEAPGDAGSSEGEGAEKVPAAETDDLEAERPVDVPTNGLAVSPGIIADAKVPLSEENLGNVIEGQERRGSESTPPESGSSGSGSDDRLIVPAASDSSGDSGGSGGSRGYVKIVQTPVGDVMTESEFLARPIAAAGEEVTAGEAPVEVADEDAATKVPAATDAPSNDAQETASTQATAESVANDEGTGAEEGSESQASSTAEASAGGEAKKRTNNRRKKKRKGKRK